MQNISGDITNEICKYLIYIEKHSLKNTCRNFYYNIVLDDIRNIILNKLKNVTNDPAKFLQALFLSGAVISGSFILECLYDSKYENSDIDIYCREDKPFFNYHKYDNTRFNEQKTSTNPLDHVFTKYIYKYLYNETYHNYKEYEIDIESSQLMVRTFRKSSNINDTYQKPIQQIICGKNPFQFIRTEFDMDLCKLAFDGFRLSIYNINDIYTKQTSYSRAPSINFLTSYFITTVDPKCSTKSSMSRQKVYTTIDLVKLRINKYIDRGFSVIPNNYWNHCLLVNDLIYS